MPNSFFQFKQFRVNQVRSGMKVTTDGCLFGAYVANSLEQAADEPNYMLDIGTGTGLLALILAQVTNRSSIEAIDMSENAHSEAGENFNASHWKDRLFSSHQSLQKFNPSRLYDLIICNPPFFGKSQKGTTEQKNQAIHNDHLSMEELSSGIDRLLTNEGVAWIMYPEWEMKAFIKWMEKSQILPCSTVLVRNKAEAPVFRMIVKFSRSTSDEIQRELLIREGNGSYSQEFLNLVENYYL
ncbi:MAG: methyltransferase [Cyclobacteriaceae bacterium]